MGSDFTECGLERLIKRFPELATSVQDRLHDDPSFREMCSDYAETLEMLQRWHTSDDPHRAARIEEYRALAEGLEIEIVTALRPPTPGSKHDLR